MRATDLLRKQHREVEGLFGELLKCDDARACRSLSVEISTLLEIHMTIEESIFYPAYRASTGTRRGEQQVLQAFEEHHVIDLLLAELPRIDPSVERFDATVTVFKGLVERHVEAEELEMFRDAERRIDRERLEELGLQMADRAEHLAR